MKDSSPPFRPLVRVHLRAHSSFLPFFIAFLLATLLLVSAENTEHARVSSNNSPNTVLTTQMPSNTIAPLSFSGGSDDPVNPSHSPHIIHRTISSTAINPRNHYTLKLREKIVEIYGSNLTVWAPPPLIKVHTPCLKFGLSCPPEYVKFLEDTLRQALHENATGNASFKEGCDIASLDVRRWVFTGSCAPGGTASEATEESYSNSLSADKIDHIAGLDSTKNAIKKEDTKSPPARSTVSFPGCPGCKLGDLTLLENLQQYVRVLENKLAQVRRAKWYNEASEVHQQLRSQTGDTESPFIPRKYAAWISRILLERTGAVRYTRCAQQRIKRWLIDMFLIIDLPLTWLFFWVFVRLLPCTGMVAFGVWVWADMPWPDSVIAHVLNLPKKSPKVCIENTSEKDSDGNATKLPGSHLKASNLHEIHDTFAAEVASAPLACSPSPGANGEVNQAERIETSVEPSTSENGRGSMLSPLLGSNSEQNRFVGEKGSTNRESCALQTRHEEPLNILDHQIRPLTSERNAALQARQHRRQVAVSFTLMDDFFSIDSTYFFLLRVRLALCLLTLLALLWCGFECYRHVHRLLAYGSDLRGWSGINSSGAQDYRGGWMRMNALHLQISSAISASTRVAGRFLQRLLPSWLSASIGLYVLYSFLGSVVLVAFRETFSAFQELLEAENESAVRQIPILRLDPMDEVE